MFSENSTDIKDTNEKLFIDSYYLIQNNRKNKTPAEASDALRDVIRQVKFHSDSLKIAESGAEKLKNEFISEYFDCMDSMYDHSSLLPVCNNKAVDDEKFPEHHIIKNAVGELNSHLNNLQLKLPSPSSSSPLFKSFIASDSNNSDELNLSVKPTFKNSFRISKPSCIRLSQQTKETFDNMDEYIHYSDPSSFQTKPAIQRKVFHSRLSTKRHVEEDQESNSECLSKKLNKNNSKFLLPKKEAPKSSGSGFVSASSMYRNPLKKAEKDNGSLVNSSTETNKESELNNQESLKHFDKKIIDVIFNEIMDFSPNVKWSDIAGLDFVKTTVQEIVTWPILRPELFTGLRAPPRGILLFGPPGTGKTLIGKCIATESKSTFFCISASSLASKWVGESEQMVRALFTIARVNKPSVIFIDEIDSLLSQRSDQDQDFSRKLKTEFLVQFDGAKTSSEDGVLVVGATNRPHELDEAARRRFVKRLYVPLPEESARLQIIQKLLAAHEHELSENDLCKICDETKGYSGSDVAHLCKEAAMGPIRSIGPENIKTVSLEQVRSINLNDFMVALKQVRASVAQDDLDYYLEWNKKFGSFAA